MNLFTQRSDAARDFIEVAIVITQSAFIAVAAAESTIIQDKHFNTQIFGILGQLLNQIFLVEIKTKTLPGIDQNRSFFLLPMGSDDVFIDEIMEVMGKIIQTLIGIGKDGLRCFKGFICL